MLKNKKNIVVILICFVILSICISAFAHSGRTDSNGGHYNRATGEYHYHTGEYAGRDSSSGVPWYVPYLIFLIIVILAYLIYRLYCWISASLPSTVITNLRYAIIEYENAINHALYCNKTLNGIKEKAIIPNGYEIGKDGLPKEIDSSDWGKSLTLYKLYNGWKLHLEEACCGEFCHRQNIYRFHNKRYSLCQKCASDYQIPNMEWYIEYLKLPSQIQAFENAKHRKNKALSELHKCFNSCNAKITIFLLFFQSSKKQQLNELKRKYNQIIKKESYYVS